MAKNNIEKNSNIEEINEDTVSESKVAGNSEKQEKPKTTKTTTHKSGAKKSTTTSKTKKSSKENSSTAKKTSSSRIGKNTKKEIAIEEPVKANTKTKSKTTKKGASNTTKTSTTKKTTTPTEKKTNAKKITKSGNTNKVEKSKAVKKSKKTDDRIKQIINEQLNNVDKFEEVKEVPAKRKKDKKKIDEKQIEEQIEIAKKMPKDEKKKIYKKVFANIILGIVVTLYFIGIGIGFLNIDGPTFITDLKVFSLSILAIAIILFEFAYGKDDDKTAPYGHQGMTQELEEKNAFIAQSMDIGKHERPAYDVHILEKMGYKNCIIDPAFGKRVLKEKDLKEAPMFMIMAGK